MVNLRRPSVVGIFEWFCWTWCAQAVVSSCVPPIASANDATVVAPKARIETEPVPSSGDAADDPAIWIHPDDPSKSLVLGTDKKGGLNVFDMDGKRLQIVSDGARPNNVDVIYDFPHDGATIDLAVAGTRKKTSFGIGFWRIDRASRRLSELGPLPAFPVFGGREPYGSCVYRSRKDRSFYVFVTSKDGEVEQLVPRSKQHRRTRRCRADPCLASSRVSRGLDRRGLRCRPRPRMALCRGRKRRDLALRRRAGLRRSPHLGRPCGRERPGRGRRGVDDLLRGRFRRLLDRIEPGQEHVSGVSSRRLKRIRDDHRPSGRHDRETRGNRRDRRDERRHVVEVSSGALRLSGRQARPRRAPEFQVLRLGRHRRESPDRRYRPPGAAKITPEPRPPAFAESAPC